MNIKILQEYLKICSTIGVKGTTEGFYSYVKSYYPEEVNRLNVSVINGLFS